MERVAEGFLCSHCIVCVVQHRSDIKFHVQTCLFLMWALSVVYPGILFGGGSTNSVEDRGQREQGSGGGSPLVRGSGGSCN